MIYIFEFYNGSYMRFETIKDLYKVVFDNHLSIESEVHANDNEVLFRVYDEYGDDVALFKFFYEAK